MTQDSDFKKIVRARVSKTGESYTAARAVLLADHWCDRCFDRGGCNNRCVRCGEQYCQVPDVPEDYFRHPTDYSRGSLEYCLACWLGIGPIDIAEWDANGGLLRQS